MKDHEARRAALKRIKEKLEDVPVQKIIDPVIENATLKKRLIVAFGFIIASLGALEYFL